MTPQKQLIQHDPENGLYGDCQRTCVAVILDLHPSEVPHFCDGDAGDWAAKQADWLRARGLGCATVAYDGSASLEQVMIWTSRQSPDVPMILLGKSSLGGNHVVVVQNGEIVCDPSGNGILGPSVEGIWEVSMICIGTNHARDASQDQQAQSYSGREATSGGRGRSSQEP